MITKKELIGNALLREIMCIRVDALARMLSLRERNQLPGIHDEGATGDYDNKGALFVPGGLVLEDSDRRPIRKVVYPSRHAAEFRAVIRECMKNDNATLLFKDGFVEGVNLDNGFFAEMSSQILAIKQTAGRRPRTLERHPPHRILSDHICKSLCPESMPMPYGARTKISSCLAVCLSEPRLYYIHCRNEFALRGAASRRAWERIRSARLPVKEGKAATLVPPYIVVCHQTRYKEQALCGITRILGIGEFGEFATISLDLAIGDVADELKEKDIAWRDSDVFATCDGKPVLGIIRIYRPTRPGARSRGTHVMLISPQRDLGLDVDSILRASRERYHLN